MFPLCSTTANRVSQSQIALHGTSRHFPLYGKIPFHGRPFEVKFFVEGNVVPGLSNGVTIRVIPLRGKAITCSYSNFVQNAEGSIKMDISSIYRYPYQLSDTYSTGASNQPINVANGGLKFVDNSSIFTREEELVDLANQSVVTSDILLNPDNTLAISVIGDSSNDPTSLSNSWSMASNASVTNTSIEDFLNGTKGSISDLVSKGENALKSTFDEVTSSITSVFKGVNKAVDSSVNNVKVSVDHVGESASNKLLGLFGGLNEASSRLISAAVDALRYSIIKAEDSLTQGVTFTFYAYKSAKDLLPQDIHNVLDQSEEKVIVVLRPIGTAFQQVNVALGGLERSLGLDSDDPIVTFVVFIGTLAALWVSYWTLSYGGYAGDLSPKETLEFLIGKENVALIDIRTEDLRYRDGIPDLRRAARFRYANVTLPEVDGSVKRLLRGGRDLDDTLVAAIIQNLKIVQDRSSVIVMDADGTRSKGIARALRKLGVKRPYLVRGGFGSWMNEGLRFKELKPDTALTVLNEEAEAIIEDINPTPLKVFGYALGSIAASYALLEWEKTLQVIGVVGLAQTIYQRLASYESSNDFKRDLSLLLVPVRLGGDAISWAAGKLEANRNGLPTSPSSSDVQNRVLQAAAKHESQPSDGEESQVLSPEIMASVNENVDLSEA